MENTDTAFGNREGTAVAAPGSDHSTGFEHVKTFFADTIDKAAEALSEKSTNPDAHHGMAQYEKQASEWLEKSAEYVRHFDPDQADVRLREYVGRKPGRSLLIAGGIGLVIGVILRGR